MALAPASWPRPLRRAIRITNKYLLNPIVGARAGRKDAYAGVIRHTGRKSGRQYSNPVGIDRVPDGFLIPLGYGTGVDWLRNVLAAGRATIAVDGETYDVVEPVVIDAVTALPMLPQARRRTFERVGISQYLTVKLADGPGTA